MWVGVSLGFGVEGSCVSSNKPLKRIARGGEQLRRPAADPHTIGGRGSASLEARSRRPVEASEPRKMSGRPAVKAKPYRELSAAAPGVIGVPLVESTRGPCSLQ